METGIAKGGQLLGEPEGFQCWILGSYLLSPPLHMLVPCGKNMTRVLERTCHRKRSSSDLPCGHRDSKIVQRLL